MDETVNSIIFQFKKILDQRGIDLEGFEFNVFDTKKIMISHNKKNLIVINYEDYNPMDIEQQSNGWKNYKTFLINSLVKMGYNTKKSPIFIPNTIQDSESFENWNSESSKMGYIKLVNICSGIGKPVVIKMVKFPGKTKESLVIATQNGIIYKVGTITEKILDITQNIEYGEDTGLLGMEFHPNFQENGLFYTYSSMKNSGTGHIDSIDDGMWDERVYDHLDVLEEHRFDPVEVNSVPIRTILKVKQPFQNNNGMDVLGWDYDLGLMILAIGDGGYTDRFRADPLNLAQNDCYVHGKILGMYVDKMKEQVSPVARFDDIEGRGSIKMLASGLRNGGAPVIERNDYTDVRYFNQMGETNMESIYAFDYYPQNFGWRAMEGGWPTIIKQNGAVGERKKTFIVRDRYGNIVSSRKTNGKPPNTFKTLLPKHPCIGLKANGTMTINLLNDVQVDISFNIDNRELPLKIISKDDFPIELNRTDITILANCILSSNGSIKGLETDLIRIDLGDEMNIGFQGELVSDQIGGRIRGNIFLTVSSYDTFMPANLISIDVTDDRPINLSIDTVGRFASFEGDTVPYRVVGCRYVAEITENETMLGNANSHLLTIAYPNEALNMYQFKTPILTCPHNDTRGDRLSIQNITGVTPYQGIRLGWLSNKILFIDRYNEEIESGTLYYANPKRNNLDRAIDYDRIEIDSPVDNGTLFTALGSNSKNDRLFLGTYSKDGNLSGRIYEIV